jgi:hypothetical protein
MRRARNTLRSDETANDKDKEIIEEGEAERDLQPTRDMEKAKVGHVGSRHAITYLLLY